MYIYPVDKDLPALEWDENKRQSTLRDRGLDFADLEAFDWETALTIQDSRGDYGETRYVSLGILGTRLVVAAYTLREAAYRIISLRKANKREQEIYEDRKTPD